MRIRIGMLALLLLLGACQGGPPVKPSAPRASSTGVKPAASVQPVANELLAPPKAAFTKLVGTIAVDAGYLLSDAGAQLQPDGKGLFVANNGAGSVASSSGNLVSNNGGGIISDHGNGLLSDAGASLLAAADAGLLGDAGAAIIANNGGGLIGKVKYRLAQAGPALGTALPVGGMVVLALDMASGKAVPLGQDGAGNPVYAVQSNAAGSYELYLPQGLPRNVRLVAVAPGTRDIRLVYSLVTPVQATAARSLDEDTALATRYLRGSMVSYITNELLQHVAPDPTAKPNPVVAAFAPLLAQFQELARQKGADRLGPEAARQVAQAMADTVCAYADLSAMQTSNVDTEWKGDPEPAIPAMITVLKAVNAAAAAKLRQDPRFFDQRPFLVDANQHRAAQGLPPYVLEKPADVGELMFHEYVNATGKRQQEKMRFAFVDLGLPLDQYERFRAAYSGTFLGLAQLLVSDEAAKGAALATLDASLAAAASVGSSPKAEPTTPAPGYGSVSTLTGAADPGFLDGPLEAARYTSPGGLALDDAGNLYLADTGNHRIRKIGADGKVTTIAGGDPGYADGPGDKAQFALPRGLLLDQAHNLLYVSEVDKPRIRKIALGDQPVVSTVAGDGTPGFADGPAAAARFNVPLGMALDATGALFVADHDNDRIRKIAADGSVTTVLGSAGTAGFSIGDPLSSVLHGPSDLFFDGSGRLIVAEQNYIGVLSTTYNVLAGNGWGGGADGYWVNAQVDYPSGIAPDGQGGCIVLEEIGGRVRHAVPVGPDALKLTTVLPGGGPEEESFADGPGLQARMAKPLGLAVSKDGKRIYVSDTRNHRIRVVQE